MLDGCAMRRIRRMAVYSILASVSMVACSRMASAIPFEYGDITGSFDTTVSAGLSFRTSERDPRIIGRNNGGEYVSANHDDGSLNFGPGIVAAPVRALHEFAVKHTDEFGAFFRFSYFYDPINADRGAGDFRRLPNDAIHRLGYAFNLYDGYVYANTRLLDRDLNVRVGNQVLNWGESTFLPNGINGIVPLDLSALRSPGAELRQAFLPFPAVDATIQLADNLSLEGFYQFLRQETRLDPAGTFFATEDTSDPGGRFTLLNTGGTLGPLIPDRASSAFLTTADAPLGGAIPRDVDRLQREQGSFGFALRYTADFLNDTEFGLYFQNYNARTPAYSVQTGTNQGIAQSQAAFVQLLGQLAGGGAEEVTAPTYASTARYFLEYPRNIQTYGLSFNTSGPLGIALQGEMTYRRNQPFQIQEADLVVAGLAPALSQLSPLLAAAQAAELGLPPAAAPVLQQRLLGALQNSSIIRHFGGLAAVSANERTTLPGYFRTDAMTFQLTGTKLFGPIAGTPVQSWTIVNEWGLNYINGFPSENEVYLGAPLGSEDFTADPLLGATGLVPFNRTNRATQTSYGYVLLAAFNMPDLIGGVIDMTPKIAWSHDIRGTTPDPYETFIQNRASFSVGADFSYKKDLNWGVQYTYRFGLFGADRFNPAIERDFASVYVSYTF